MSRLTASPDKSIRRRPQECLAYPWPKSLFRGTGVAIVVTGLYPSPHLAFAWLATGAVLVAGGLAISLNAIRSLHARHTTEDVTAKTTCLVTDGPYHLSRNPIYFAYVLIWAGLSVALQSEFGLALTVIGALGLQSVVWAEERYLQQRFPAEFTLYRRQVRRWL